MIKPNLLISGCTGFVGKNLINSEFFKDFNLYCLIRRPEQENILKSIKSEIKLIKIDEINNQQYPLSIDACIHLAAYGVNPNQDKYDEFINSNILLTLKLYEFSKKYGCKIFINVGSVFEYGEKNVSSILSETTIPSPNSLYGASKYSAHLLLSALKKNIDLKFITVRPFGLFGRFESMNRLYPQVINSGFKNQPLKLTEGSQIRNIVYVMDFVKFLSLLVINQDKITEEVVNFTNSIPVTIKDFINHIIIKLKFNQSLFQFGLIPYRKNESMIYTGENCLMNSFFKNFQFTDLDVAIEESFSFYK